MKLRSFRLSALLCCFILLSALCGCAPSNTGVKEFSPDVTVTANAQRAEITLEGTADLPDGTLLTVQIDGANAARNAILEQYGSYTALPVWCDNNGFAALSFPAQTAVVQDGKFFVALPMDGAPYQTYSISLSVMPDEGQPEAVIKLLDAQTAPTDSTIGLHAVVEAVYPNPQAAEETTAAALAKAEAFIAPQLANLDKLCEATAQVYTDMLQNDRKLSKLTPSSEAVCTIAVDGDCVVMTLDNVYWDYYLHPDLEVYQPDDYRDTLAESWMLPALQQFEGTIQILYGHKPCGKFLASDGRVIAVASTDYEITFREISELDAVSSGSV